MDENAPFEKVCSRSPRSLPKRLFVARTVRRCLCATKNGGPIIGKAKLSFEE
jgi:hypothetical protein